MSDPALKNSLIAKIHIAKKQLAMKDDDYRSFLERVTGKTSCKDMTVPKLKDVLEQMKGLGFKAKSNPAQAGTRKLAASPQAKKIRAMWLDMHSTGVVKDQSEGALAAFVKTVTGIDDMKWLDSKDANKVINALRGWIRRTGGLPK